MYSVTYFFKWLLHKDMNYGNAEAKCHDYHHCFLGYRLYASQSIGLSVSAEVFHDEWYI
jgi:hypothetical protein